MYVHMNSHMHVYHIYIYDIFACVHARFPAETGFHQGAAKRRFRSMAFQAMGGSGHGGGKGGLKARQRCATCFWVCRGSKVEIGEGGENLARGSKQADRSEPGASTYMGVVFYRLDPQNM